MAKKNKEPITGLGRDPENKLVVQKSNPLTVLSRSDLSLAELKILDMYLARMDTHKPDHRTVKLTKGQLEAALGVTQLKKSDLQQRLKNLYQPIDLAKDDKKSLHLISLFEEALAEQDNNGVWQITLTCTQSAMKYMFCIEEYGYFRYKLHGIVSLKSRYSLLLFMYLEKNRFRKSWEVSLDALKHDLNCDNDELYNEFKMLNQRILKRCQKELHEKTECHFTYEPVKKGRSVVAVRFTLETLPKLVLDSNYNPAQITLENYLESSEDEHLNRLNFLRSACSPIDAEPEFTIEEMEQLLQVLTQIDQSKLPTFGLPTDDVWFARYHYLAERYANMNRIQAKTPIKNRFAYFLKMVRADA